MDAAALGLLELDPWADTSRALSAAQDKLLEADATTLSIGGPTSVALDVRDSLPVVGMRGFDPAAVFPADFSREGLVTVSRVEAREVLAETVFMLRNPPPPQAAQKPRSGLSTQPFAFEVRDRLPDLPWQSGTIVVTVHFRDQASNRLRVKLSPGAVVEHDPAVQEYIERQRRERAAAGPPAPIWPPMAPAAPAHYKPLPASPPLPEAPGIALAAERVVVLGRDRCVLHGRWRLPARLTDQVRPVRRPGARPEDPPVLPDVGDPEAKAVVPITLVIGGHSNANPGPTLIPLRVPSHDPVPPSTDPLAEPLVTGSFSIDLLGMRSMPRFAQGYTIWALAGEHLSSPCSVSFITPDMLQA